MRVKLRSPLGIAGQTKADLSSRSLTAADAQRLRDELTEAEGLVELYLKENRLGTEGIQTLAPALAQVASLRVLHLARNRLGDAGVASLCAALSSTSVEDLDLDTNQLTAASGRPVALLLRAGRIKTIKLLSNALAEGVVDIAKALSDGTAVTHINLGDNKVDSEGAKALGTAVAKAEHLTELMLPWNDIGPSGCRGLALGLQESATLEILDLRANRIGDAGAIHLGEAVRHSLSLQVLKLDSNHLTHESALSIGKAIGSCQSLVDLSLDKNKIGSVGAHHIASGLKLSKSLKVLWLYRCVIGSAGGVAMGEALEANSSLEKLDLGANALRLEGAQGLARGVAASSLRTLYLTWNHFGDDGVAALGTAVASCKSIVQVRLMNNKITDAGARSFCDAIAGHPNIEILKLGRNKITTLPKSLFGLRLVELEVQENPLSSLPLDFLLLKPTLKKIDLRECPCQTPPKELVQTNDLPKIFAFLEALENEGGVACRQSRLLLIGLGEVGKTSLQRALLSETNATSRIGADDRTVGIDITAWRPDAADDFGYQVWDFAGQRVYYGTHQFFLSARVQYVLVWSLADTRGLRAMVQEWLDALQARVPQASVVLVATHADAVDAESARVLVGQTQAFVREYLADSGSTVSVARDGASYVVSCTAGTGIAEARAAIVGAGKALPHVGEEIPKSWVVVRDVLRDMDTSTAKDGKAPVATMAEVVAASTSDRMSAESVREAVSLWHELGEVFVHGDLVVLRPQWIVDVLKAIVTHEMSSELRDVHSRDVAHLELHGRLSWALAQELLETVAPRTLHRELMAILGAFEVVIEVQAGAEWIVPVLLPAGEWDPAVEAEWPMWAAGESTGHSAQLDYRFIPAGLFHRLCVQAHSALEWEAEDYHATFARFRCADGTRLFVELGEASSGRRQLVTVHGRGPQSWAAALTVLKAARSLSQDFFRGSDCQVTRAGGIDAVRWDRLTEDRFRAEAPAGGSQRKPPAARSPVMLSYKHRDREGELALAIRDRLDASRIGVWIDLDGIVGGATWRQAIAQGIQDSLVVVFALSGRSVASAFCAEEVCLAMRLGKPVIPVLVSAPPSRAEYRAQMLRLRDTQWVDFHSQPFEISFRQLRERVLERIRQAGDSGVAYAAPSQRARAVIPEFEDERADDLPRSGSVFIAHSTTAEDSAAAAALKSWLLGAGHFASCSVRAVGERVSSPIRREELQAAGVVVALVTMAYVADDACWTELCDWDESSAGIGSLVPVFLEQMGVGWQQAGMELLLARHEDSSTDLCAGGTPAEVARKVRLLATKRTLVPDNGSGAGASGDAGGHVVPGVPLAPIVDEAEKRAEAAERRAEAAEQRAEAAERRVEAAEARAEAAGRRADAAETRAEAAEKRAEAAEKRAEAAERRAAEVPVADTKKKKLWR